MRSPNRSLFPIFVLATLAIATIPPGVQGGVYPGFSELVTDSTAVFAMPDAPRPTYLKGLTDPTFGTFVTRITGHTGTAFNALNGNGYWGSEARHHYSKDQPWNSDGTLLAIQNTGYPKHVLLDGETYEPLYLKCASYIVDDDRWHPSLSHPHERINVRGNELMWFDVVNCIKTRSWTLPFEPIHIGGAEGNPSNDGRFLALHDSARIVIVDMDPKLPYAPYPASRIGPVYSLVPCCKATWVSVSMSGKYLVVNQEDHLRVYDINPATLAITPRSLPGAVIACSGLDPKQGYLYDVAHADLALNPFDSNEDVLVGQEHCGNRGAEAGEEPLGGVVMIRLRDGALTSLTDPVNESYPHHISARNIDRPGWVYVGYWPYEGTRFADEVVAVRMDGSGAVQRFAHRHSATSGCYRCESHAVPSRDGRRILFASNWSSRCTLCGTPGDIKAYVVDARDDIGNLIANPSFEYSTTGWGSTGGATIVRVAGGVDGLSGARVTGSVLTEFGLNDSPNSIESAVAGARYRVTAWVRSPSSHGRIAIKLREYAGGSQVGATAMSPWVTLAPEWQRVVLEYVVRQSGSSLDLRIVDQPLQVAETFHIDDIVIAQVANHVTGVPEIVSPDALPARVAPNPLRKSSALEFAIGSPGPVRVRVFDVAGRQIATMLDEPALAAGTHRVPLGALMAPGRLHGGMYFCRLETHTGCSTQRFVVLD